MSRLLQIITIDYKGVSESPATPRDMFCDMGADFLVQKVGKKVNSRYVLDKARGIHIFLSDVHAFGPNPTDRSEKALGATLGRRRRNQGRGGNRAAGLRHTPDVRPRRSDHRLHSGAVRGNWSPDRAADPNSQRAA